MSEMIERIARAIDEADFGFRMDLIRLVDGVHTYELLYSDGLRLEFGDTDDLYAHVRQRKQEAQARAVIRALREPTNAMCFKGAIESEHYDAPIGNGAAEAIFQAMIDEALR